MNYAERCRALAARNRETAKELDALYIPSTLGAESDLDNEYAALLDAAAGLYEAANQEHGGTDGEPLECPICNALTAADAAAKGAE